MGELTRRQFLLGEKREAEQFPEVISHKNTLQIINVLENTQTRPISRRTAVKAIGMAILSSFSILTVIEELYSQTKRGGLLRQKILNYKKF